MSLSLEDLLDASLDRRRRVQHKVGQDLEQKAIDDDHAKLECAQSQFHTDVRSLVQQAIERANRHLAKRPEHCEFCDVSGYYTGPNYVGASACNPIAYELHVDGRKMGETLLVELTHDGMIEASLGAPPPPAHQAYTPRIEFGWYPVRLGMFNASTASDLLVRYVTAIPA